MPPVRRWRSGGRRARARTDRSIPRASTAGRRAASTSAHLLPRRYPSGAPRQETIRGRNLRRCARRPQLRLPCPHGSLPQARRVRMARAPPRRSRISLASRVGIRGAAAGLLARGSALAANRGFCLDCKRPLARAFRRGSRRDHDIGPRLAHRSGLAPGRDRRRADACARDPGVVRGSGFGRRGLLRSGVLSVAGATIPSCWYRTATPAPLPEAPRSTPWPQADAILASTASPAIPSRTFALAGARGDGDGDDTLALQRAIDGCHASGGGHVVIPRGVFVTGALRMRSRVDLNLSAGATLLFSEDSGRFPPVRTRYEGLECVNRSPMLYAWEETDLALTGSGTLDASRTAAWNRGSDREGVLEPMVARGLAPDERVVVGRLRTAMVETIGCARVLIQGVTLSGAPFWQLHPTLCTDVTIEGVTTSDSGPNSDGCNPESCERVVIRRCTFASGDDDIALKSGRDEDGRRLAAPCRNVVVLGCQAEGPYGFLACGSEQSGGVENVYAFGNRAYGFGVGAALWLKSNTRRGGYTRNVNLSGFQGRV
ncbi:MAG: hypothetical protein E6J66_02885, partial [Deltaproteobacteria bacterium]